MRSLISIIIKEELVGLMFYQNKSEYKVRCLHFNWKYSIVLEFICWVMSTMGKKLSVINAVSVIGFHDTDLAGE